MQLQTGQVAAIWWNSSSFWAFACVTVGLTVGVGLGVHLGLAGARLLAAKYTEYSAHCQTVGDSSDTVGSDIIELSRGRMWLIADDLKNTGNTYAHVT